ncbi:MAG: hypothetical protein IPM34_07380 [Saprospiraceae bacterium]|nr:hypothetical protein [Saprospiraceae bacterium]
MKNYFLFYLLLTSYMQAFSREPMLTTDLKTIEIRKSKYYKQGIRLMAGKPLELALHVQPETITKTQRETFCKKESDKK